MTRLPRPAQWLLRVSGVPRPRRAEVHADLEELFTRRHADRGAFYAYWRLYHDLASLWLRPRGTNVDVSPSTLVQDARGDLRHAARLFARQPAILLLTIAGLSLGLAVSTAAFSIMNAAIRGEGLVDSDRAPGVLRTTARSVSTAWTYDEFMHLREGATRVRVEAVLTEDTSTRLGSAEDVTPSVSVGFVSGGFFTATGGRMMLGRALDMADEQHTGPPAVVVSFVFWNGTLNQDPAIIGRTIRIGRTDATVVGVAARGFSLPNNRLMWMPITAYGAVFNAGTASRAPGAGLQVFARLLPDTAVAEAEAQLNGVAASLPRAAVATESAVRVQLDAHTGLGRASSSETLVIIAFVIGAIVLVLLLACANVATVLIATAITREREMGLRAALGASQWRIVRQLVTESLALGIIAAAAGLMLASWAIPLVGTMIDAPAGSDMSPDANVFAFLGVVTIATGVAAGLAPAWHGRGADLVTPLKGEGASTNRVPPRRLRSMLVMTQAAASVLLIILASLFVRATFRASAIDVGFDARGLYAVSPGLGDAFAGDGDHIKDYWTRALAELPSVPGVTGVTLAELLPYQGLTRTSITRDNPSRVVHFNRTDGEYFDVIGVRILAGRTYTASEAAAKAPVAVVSESLARTYWQGQSPLGQLLPPEIPVTPLPALGLLGTRPIVIGVVADAITDRLHERATLAVYEPLDPTSERFAQLMIRTAPGDANAVSQLSQRLRAIDPEADVRITSIAALLQQETSHPRMLASLTGIVGAIAIVLCVIGLYGLTASLVGQRAREIAVRVAMGAESTDLLRLLMWDSLKPVVIGVAVGASTGLLVTRAVVAAMFFGVSPQDPIAFAAAAIVLLTAATVAVLMPTRRAAVADAASLLRRS